eukprot:scaffold4906_cov158-Chaetoceros_neogracile.AAC.1
MTSLGIGIVVKAIAKDVKQSAELNPRMIRWYVVLIPLIDRSTMEIIIIEDRKDIDPVTIAMIIPAFVKTGKQVDYRVSRGQKKTRVFKFETVFFSIACRSAVPGEEDYQCL